MSSKKAKKNVLRVTQLDSGRIDNEIFRILQTEYKYSLQHDSLSILLHLEPELNAIIRFILWKLSIKKLGITIGQKLFNTEYVCSSDSMTENQRDVYAIIFILMPWIRERYSSIIKLVKYFMGKNGESEISDKFDELCNYSEIFLKLISVINFLLFLKYGKYANLFERLFTLDHVYNGNPKPRYIDYNYMKKEMVWDGVTQALLCLVPLINVKKIANTVRNICKKNNKETVLDIRERFKCPICSERAANPYNGKCGHIFCYICIASNVMADKNYTCPVCGLVIIDILPTCETI